MTGSHAQSKASNSKVMFTEKSDDKFDAEEFNVDNVDLRRT